MGSLDVDRAALCALALGQSGASPHPSPVAVRECVSPRQGEVGLFSSWSEAEGDGDGEGDEVLGVPGKDSGDESMSVQRRQRLKRLAKA
jgi:hypothetical protein